MTYYGEYGGRVLRAFKGETPFIVGAELSAEEVMNWPISNRKALHSTHKVEWYGPPRDSKEPVQRPAPKKADEPKTPAVKSSGSTKANPRRRA